MLTIFAAVTGVLCGRLAQFGRLLGRVKTAVSRPRGLRPWARGDGMLCDPFSPVMYLLSYIQGCQWKRPQRIHRRAGRWVVLAKKTTQRCVRWSRNAAMVEGGRRPVLNLV